jgi:DNA-binding transcriptional LysR family regulator
MALDLQKLRHVIALSEHGSFVRAAAALHISQPALSRSIQTLEARFGSELFLRTNSGVVPTDLGRIYVARARDLLRMADDLEREAVSHGRLRAGRVAVGGGPYPADTVLARAAGRFVEAYPGVSVKVVARDWDELARRLRSRELDFFVAETSTLQGDADLEVSPLSSRHPIYLIARAGHPLAGRGDVNVNDILEWPFVTPSRVPPRVLTPLLAAHRAATQRTSTMRPFPSIECDALSPTKRAVATSDAVTGTILSCIAGELERGEFVLLAREPWLYLEYGIVSLRGVPRTQAAERFVEFVLDAEKEASAIEERLLKRVVGRQRRPRRDQVSREDATRKAPR